MKKIIWLFFLLLISIILSSCKEEITIEKHYKTQVVQTGSISTNTSYSSFTKGITKTYLSPESSGKIIFLGKKKGDRVTKGEKIASLDFDEAITGHQTSNNIINSLNELKNSISETYDAQIQTKKESLKKVEEELKGIDSQKENTINTNNSEISVYKNALESTKINLQLLEKNLEQTQNILDEKNKQIYKNAKNAITSSLILDTSIIDFIDELLGVTDKNKYKNDAYEDYLSAKNNSYFNEAIELFNTTNTNFLDYKNFYETYVENKDMSKEEIIKGLNKGNSLAEELKQLLNKTNDVLGASVESEYLSLSQINSLKQSIYEFGNNIESSILTVVGEYNIGLKGSLDSIELFEKNSQKELVILEEQITLGEKQVETSQENLEKIKNINTGNIDDINTQKEIGNISISEIQSTITYLEKEKLAKLKEIDIQINEAKGNQNISNIQINNSEIKAPFTGIITDKFYEIGTLIAGGTPIYKLVDDSEIKLEVDINRNLANSLKIGNSLYVEIEGNINNFSGIVKTIAPIQETDSKNTQIEIIIDNKDHQIVLGTTAKVFISNDSEEGIVIPNNAIISNFMIPAVMTLNNGIANLKNIKIIEQNDTSSLVTGIEVGENIIIKGQENILDGEEL